MFAATLTNLRFNRDAVSRLYADVQQLSAGINRPTAIQSRHFTFLKLQLKGVGYRYPNTRQDAVAQTGSGDPRWRVDWSDRPLGERKDNVSRCLAWPARTPNRGARIQRHPLQDTLEEWRAQVAYLPQQVFLIDNSLRCNVALGEAEFEIEESRLQAALRQARLSELVEQLPKGVNTILGERGVRLSGGQRQRVALARAFYHGRSVLVMDEATSALDNETEREIVAEIQRLKGQKTMIVIAHRLTTVQHCDRIYRLEQGKIIEAGTPKQVSTSQLT